MTLDGEEKTVYLAARPWNQHEEGTEIGISMFRRTYFSLTPELDPDQFFKPKMIDGWVQYTVDLSNVDCGCITAFSTRVMPVKTETGEYDPSSDTMYFGGAQHQRALCPEWDIMEANRWSFRSTAHACAAPNEFGHYNDCDHGGTGQTDI